MDSRSYYSPLIFYIYNILLIYILFDAIVNSRSGTMAFLLLDRFDNYAVGKIANAAYDICEKQRRISVSVAVIESRDIVNDTSRNTIIHNLPTQI